MLRLLAACAMTAVLVLAGAAALDVEPANAADGPQQDAADLMLRAAVEGCAAGGGQATTRIQGGVWVSTCTEALGLGPSVKRRTR